MSTETSITLVKDEAKSENLIALRKRMPKGADTLCLVDGRKRSYLRKKDIEFFEGCEGQLTCGRSLLKKVKKEKGVGMQSGIPKKKADFEEMVWKSEDGSRSNGTGFMAAIDKLLFTNVSEEEVNGYTRSEFTVDGAVESILQEFPDKPRESVIKIVRTRPRGIEKQKTKEVEKAPRWAVALATGGNGFLTRVDELLLDSKHTMKEIVEIVMVEFPTLQNGKDRDPAKTVHQISNRGRINRKKGINSGIKKMERVRDANKDRNKKAAKKAPVKKATKKAAKKSPAKKAAKKRVVKKAAKKAPAKEV